MCVPIGKALQESSAMTLLPFVKWLAETPGSIALHESILMYPLVESIHVWTLGLFVGMASILDLRLMGMALTKTPLSDVTKRMFPYMIAGFVVMIVSGALLFYAIPVRSYQSIFFRIKVVLLILAGLNAFVFHSTVFKTVTRWDTDPTPPPRARLAGGASLVLWALIIVSGRLIAYGWFDCGPKTTASFIATLSGCEIQAQD